MKRYSTLIAILLLVAMLFSACGKSEGKKETTPPNTPVVETVVPTPPVPTVDPTQPPENPTVENPTEPPVMPDPPTVDPIDPPDDPDPIDPPEPAEIQKITTQGSGYGDILRVKSTGEVLFSPNIEELRELTSIGEDLDDFTISLVFVLLDDNGSEIYAYPSLELPIKDSKGDWFDVFLQGDGIDSGFCPTASKRYTIDVSVIRDENVLMMGTWQGVTASADYVNSPYYAPTALPSEEDLQKVDCTIEYKIQGAGGTILGKSTQILVGGAGSEKVTAVPDEGYMFAGWSDGRSEESREGDTLIRDRVIYAKFTKIVIDKGIPNMYIETETGTPVNTKNYMNATIRIVGAAEDKYNINVTTEIRGRGNSSFNGGAPQDAYDSKNSYRLKLTEKANLLGVGHANNRDWVLNSNKFDASNLRNYAVWNLANQMNTLPFVPNCSWVNLYINGDYRGVYMVTDLVEAADDRVEIDDKGEDPDKGYLIELDFRGSQETNVVEGLDYFYVPGFYDETSGGNPREWVIKSEVNTTAETDFIRSYVIACHLAILEGDRAKIDELVDIPALIDFFIIEELSKDVDAGGASVFMQKDKGGKLFFTAPWDFDFGFGTYGPATSVRNFVCENASYSPHLWLQALLKQKWFLQELQARMVEVTEMLEVTKEGIMATGAVLKSAADRNDERWGIYGNSFHGYVSYQVSGSLYDYDEHLTFLCDWIDDRWEWMTEEINFRLEQM